MNFMRRREHIHALCRVPGPAHGMRQAECLRERIRECDDAVLDLERWTRPRCILDCTVGVVEGVVSCDGSGDVALQMGFFVKLVL